jgi:hypothetical protein
MIERINLDKEKYSNIMKLSEKRLNNGNNIIHLLKMVNYSIDDINKRTQAEILKTSNKVLLEEKYRLEKIRNEKREKKLKQTMFTYQINKLSKNLRYKNFNKISDLSDDFNTTLTLKHTIYGISYDLKKLYDKKKHILTELGNFPEAEINKIFLPNYTYKKFEKKLYEPKKYLLKPIIKHPERDFKNYYPKYNLIWKNDPVYSFPPEHKSMSILKIKNNIPNLKEKKK